MRSLRRSVPATPARNAGVFREPPGDDGKALGRGGAAEDQVHVAVVHGVAVGAAELPVRRRREPVERQADGGGGSEAIGGPGDDEQGRRHAGERVQVVDAPATLSAVVPWRASTARGAVRGVPDAHELMQRRTPLPPLDHPEAPLARCRRHDATWAAAGERLERRAGRLHRGGRRLHALLDPAREGEERGEVLYGAEPAVTAGRGEELDELLRAAARYEGFPIFLIVFRNDETVVERVEGEDLGCGPPARLEEALHVVDPRRVGARARHAAVECELLTGGEGGGGVVDPEVPPRMVLVRPPVHHLGEPDRGKEEVGPDEALRELRDAQEE